MGENDDFKTKYEIKSNHSPVKTNEDFMKAGNVLLNRLHITGGGGGWGAVRHKTQN